MITDPTVIFPPRDDHQSQGSTRTVRPQRGVADLRSARDVKCCIYLSIEREPSIVVKGEGTWVEQNFGASGVGFLFPGLGEVFPASPPAQSDVGAERVATDLRAAGDSPGAKGKKLNETSGSRASLLSLPRRADQEMSGCEKKNGPRVAPSKLAVAVEGICRFWPTVPSSPTCYTIL
eukprot:scaffold193574_cov31-Tisochrysis_lutea.AAC.4